MQNIIIVTGGAGFIGSNLIKYLLEKTDLKIISIDNYSTGTKKNHVNHRLMGNTRLLAIVLHLFPGNICILLLSVDRMCVILEC